MADPAMLPKEELKRIRDLSGTTYMSAYVRLMARELEIDESDTMALNDLAIKLVEPLNIATEAAWRALMGDTQGMEIALSQFGESLDELTGEQT